MEPSRRSRFGAGLGALVLAAGAALWLCAGLLGPLFEGTASANTASASGAVSMRAEVAGALLSGASGSHPVKLYPKQVTRVRVAVTNQTAEPVSVSTVRLQGKVMALPLFVYDTAVNLRIPSGGSLTVEFPLRMNGLEGQATGLIPGGLSVLDAQQDQLASEGTVWDVRGSVVSLYGLFGLAIGVITVTSFAGALFALARGRLSLNRWRRGLTFLTPGIGLGLLLIVTLSVVRVFVPTTSVWLPILLVCSLAGFAVGYLTPTPEEGEELRLEDIPVAEVRVVEAEGAEEPAPLEEADRGLPAPPAALVARPSSKDRTSAETSIESAAEVETRPSSEPRTSSETRISGETVAPGE